MIEISLAIVPLANLHRAELVIDTAVLREFCRVTVLYFLQNSHSNAFTITAENRTI